MRVSTEEGDSEVRMIDKKCSEHMISMTTLQKVYIANEGIYAKHDKTALNAGDERLYTPVSSLSSAINFSNSASSA